MELRVLRYFLYVAEEGSITKAAARLHLTQPTLSRQLKQLEEELHCRLFERNTKGLRLTEAGLLLQQRAVEMFRLEEKIRDEFQQSEELSGTITIGAGEFKSMAEFAALFQQFQKRYPNVKLELVSGNAELIQHQLAQGLLDLGIILAINKKEGYTMHPFSKQERFGVYVDQSHVLAHNETIDASDIEEFPLWISKNDAVQNYLQTKLGSAYHQAQIVGEYTLLHNCLYFIHATNALCVSLELPLQHPELVFIPFQVELKLATAIVYPTQQLRSPLVQTFIAYLNAMLEKHS